ncbi:MAG: tRNA-dihydrouridine synthase family protein [Oscillospiraceae bacterium]|nr:tRNA-dihydrouridine synthase family protein [Oscillospiraceae bacterium]
MRCYFAPMEGLTDSIYRRLHHKYFPGLDRYYTPFFSPTMHRKLTNREERELPIADALDFTVIPQVLTKVPEDLLWFAAVCKDRGYNELNINLGCPSGTVTAKGKGSGMLADPDQLDRFLDCVFSKATLPISVKTRLGFTDPREFIQLLEIYNQYPICELTIHPRVRKQFYNGAVEIELFDHAVQNSKNPLCYNGNLCSLQDISSFEKKYPTVGAVMLGRALIADPGMVCGGTKIDTLEQFHNELLETYTEVFGNARNAMFRMKENWRHLLCNFEESDKLGKRLRKTTDISEYKAITQEIFHTLPLRKMLLADW